MNLIFVALAGLVTGFALSCWLESLCHAERNTMHWRQVPTHQRWLRCAAMIFVTMLLFVCYWIAADQWRVLDIDEVQPTWEGRTLRLFYHLILISLLIVATATDFDCYMIPDRITLPGTLIGLVGAFAVGHLQVCHLWVDWSVAVPQLRGPFIPSWYDAHRHWHALAWSTAGMSVGAGLTWAARAVSSRALGQEAMGLGDVTLMAMIGSFLGWQAVILTFLLAPMAGLTVGVLIKMLSGKTYLPYGPWLSLAAVFVLFRWSWLWHRTRLIFSDVIGLSMLGAGAVVAFIALLILVRLYRAIPGASGGRPK